MNTLEAGERFITYCEQRKLSHETIKWYRVFIKVLNDKYPELPLTPEPLEAVIGSYPGEYRRLGCFRALRAFYNWICDRNDLVNPFRKMKSPRVPKGEKPIVPLEKLQELLDYPSISKATRALIWFLADTGARIGEASSLLRSNIFDDKVTISGKTGKRTIPLSPAVRDMLLALTPEDFPKSRSKDAKKDHVFPVCTGQLTRWVSEAFKAVGLEGYHAHLLRHTFCSLFTGDLMSLKLITGHTNWQMLEHYRHNRLETAQEQHAEGSPLAQLHKNGMPQSQPMPAETNTPEITASIATCQEPPIIAQVETKSDKHKGLGAFQQLNSLGDKILIAVPASFAAGKGLTLHLQLS